MTFSRAFLLGARPALVVAAMALSWSCSSDSNGSDGSGGASGAGTGGSATGGSGGTPDGSGGSGGAPGGAGGTAGGGTGGEAGGTGGSGASGSGAVATGEYRNLFGELGYSDEEIDAKLNGAFEQLFAGNPSNQAVYYAAGSNDAGPLAQIRDIGNGDVRSEGMSYGMMIAVQMDRQAEFDALWNWAKTYMNISDPAHPAYGYFAWQVDFDGNVIDPMPAPDGEEYFATALYFASGRWGNGEGIYDYRSEADQLLDAMKNRQDITGSITTPDGTYETTGTTLFNLDEQQVRFTTNTANFATNGDHTDPSYHLPAFYELWALWGPEADRQFWRDAAAVSRDFFVATTHPTTGLSPDYANFDGSPKAASWDAGTANFRFDAWRTAMNWSFDWVWFEADPREQELSDRILAFFRSQGIDSYGNQFTLPGEPLSTDRSSGLIAMNAAAALAATEDATPFVQELWDLAVPSGPWRYYDGMLYMMALLHVSGEFRAYAPQ